MPLFQWSKRYVVQVPEVDTEHRTMFEKGRQVHQAFRSGANPEQLQGQLQDLVSYVAAHFAHEERLMRETRYGSYQWHKRQHDAAKEQAKEYEDRILAGDSKAVAPFLRFLDRWVKDHAQLSDRMMGAHLRNHAVAMSAVA